jgi:predicted metal-dependent HD superfamily phosphohydrolase
MINQEYISTKFNEVVDSHLDGKQILWALYAAYAWWGRHYHTMVHIQSMLEFLENRRWPIQDWKSVVLATFFHDAVYDTLSKDNEEKSVEFMKNAWIDNTKAENLILATKKHVLNPDIPDSAIFLDADLSILGASWELYKMYSWNIRKEYSYVSWDIYIGGRVQVLSSFLQREQIYFVPAVRRELENIARENLENEIKQLKKSAESVRDTKNHMR